MLACVRPSGMNKILQTVGIANRFSNDVCPTVTRLEKLGV